jgi:hypothetical protein
MHLAGTYFICTVIALQSLIVSLYALLLHCLYIRTAEGTLDVPKGPSPFPAPYLDGTQMTPDAFTESLERSAAKHLLSKARRIAALLPQIEVAMANGSPRAHIVTALLDVGIEVTPHQLSNVIARLRRQREDAPGLPEARPAERSNAGPKAEMDGSPGLLPVTVAPRIAGVPTLAPAPSAAPAASPASKFGAHDPRLLDEVMRSTPDMKALAKLAPRSTTQGKP